MSARASLPVVTTAVNGAPVVCRKLRTKVAFGAMPTVVRDWRLAESTTAVYWCLATMECAGPDECLAHPHACGRDRVCFAAPDDDETLGVA